MVPSFKRIFSLKLNDLNFFFFVLIYLAFWFKFPFEGFLAGETVSPFGTFIRHFVKGKGQA